MTNAKPAPAPAPRRVILEEMPDEWRASHRAAGNWGQYPLNGAERRECDLDEAEEAMEADPDGYARIVRYL